jgi:diadenosine tetraphosphate (Ap4A) HIT family hydrolase
MLARSEPVSARSLRTRCMNARGRSPVQRRKARAKADRFGQRRGHLMVVSLRHVEHVHELDWPAYAALQQLAHGAALAMQRTLAPKRVFIASLGCSRRWPPATRTCMCT